MEEPNKGKNYIDVLEAFKEEHKQIEYREAEAKKQKAENDRARRLLVMRPAIELFKQLRERYKNARAGAALYQQSDTSLAFKVHGGYVVATIQYGVEGSWGRVVYTAESPGVGLKFGWGSGISDVKNFLTVVPENEIHNLFPELLDRLAKMEVKYSEWSPRPEQNADNS